MKKYNGQFSRFKPSKINFVVGYVVVKYVCGKIYHLLIGVFFFGV